MNWDDLTKKQNEQLNNETVDIILTGSKLYENKRKIKELIFKLKNQFKDNLVIISGGRINGADKYIKKYAIEFGCTYREYTAAYAQHNLYSFLPETFHGKRYDLRFDFQRNNIMLRSAKKMMLFFDSNDKSKDFEHLVKTAIKLQKEDKLKVIIIK